MAKEKRERHTYYSIQGSAECEKCGRTWEGRNAQAVSVRHFEVTGHTVHVTVHLSYTYRATPRDEEVIQAEREEAAPKSEAPVEGG